MSCNCRNLESPCADCEAEGEAEEARWLEEQDEATDDTGETIRGGTHVERKDRPGPVVGQHPDASPLTSWDEQWTAWEAA